MITMILGWRNKLPRARQSPEALRREFQMNSVSEAPEASVEVLESKVASATSKVVKGAHGAVSAVSGAFKTSATKVGGFFGNIPKVFKKDNIDLVELDQATEEALEALTETIKAANEHHDLTKCVEALKGVTQVLENIIKMHQADAEEE